MSSRAAANRLLRRLSVMAAMAACILSGLGAVRLLKLLAITRASGCNTHATYFVVVHMPLMVSGIAVAVPVALPIAALIIERTATSDYWRLHLTYWLALLGFLFALAIWAFSTQALLGIPSACP